MSDTTEIDLLQTTDAAVWAKEFVRINGGDEGVMIGWFANMWAATHDPLARRIEELEAENLLVESLRDDVREFKQRIEELEAEKIMLLATVAMLQGDREVTDSDQ